MCSHKATALFNKGQSKAIQRLWREQEVWNESSPAPRASEGNSSDGKDDGTDGQTEPAVQEHLQQTAVVAQHSSQLDAMRFEDQKQRARRYREAPGEGHEELEWHARTVLAMTEDEFNGTHHASIASPPSFSVEWWMNQQMGPRIRARPDTSKLCLCCSVQEGWTVNFRVRMVAISENCVRFPICLFLLQLFGWVLHIFLALRELGGERGKKRRGQMDRAQGHSPGSLVEGSEMVLGREATTRRMRVWIFCFAEGEGGFQLVKFLNR